ncbi:hypothetical protein NQ317_007576 [Molorchus minor]|uniref:PDZ domain-containing protein n=1 Tax=Molorchus minor TaxID=1323400 RepID=A0ABQ9J911_9CUCU|nr:hypothetical protein NQ317_007576 [Molorchus minor]
MLTSLNTKQEQEIGSSKLRLKNSGISRIHATQRRRQRTGSLRSCPSQRTCTNRWLESALEIKLLQDSAQTPVAALSPSETTPRASFSRKAHLRQEAVDMLNDIAVRKLIPDVPYPPNSSPRRLRRHACPSDASHITDPSSKYMMSDEQFHEGLLQKCSHHFDDEAFNSLFSMEPEDGDKPPRPSSLDLYNPNQTPVAARKPRFNFSLAHNAYELNNLDAEVLDAPNLTYNLGNENVTSTDAECGDSFPKEPASMPHISVDNTAFNHRNPAYQSAHPQIGSDVVDYVATAKSNVKQDDGNMKKWKNVVLQYEQNAKASTSANQMPLKEEYEVLAIELTRGWNSRLGFSLQGAAGVTYVSAVHADSVNDESIEHMTTSEIIDLLRIVRGPVCIVVSRVKSIEDCPQSNAEN